MPTATYRPPDILHWFSTGSQEAIESAMRKGRAFTKSATDSTVKENIKRAAGMAADMGRGAAAGVLHMQAVEIVYKLREKRMDVRNASGSHTVEYDSITSITLHPKDRFTIEYGAISATDGLAGTTEGSGAADPGETDLDGGGSPYPALGTTYEHFTAGDNDLDSDTLDFDP